MKKVSEAAQEVLANLIEWELLGQDKIDLKVALRSLSLPDLSVVMGNIDDIPGALERFVCARLVRLEMDYRLGRITDWSYVRDGAEVAMSFTPTTPLRYITLNLSLNQEALDG